MHILKNQCFHNIMQTETDLKAKDLREAVAN